MDHMVSVMSVYIVSAYVCNQHRPTLHYEDWPTTDLGGQTVANSIHSRTSCTDYMAAYLHLPQT